MNHHIKPPEQFNPYAFLSRLETGLGDNRTMLSDQFRASDLGEMLKTVMIAVELLSARVKELEARPVVDLPDLRGRVKLDQGSK